jgi:hypothetical protein
MRKSQFDIQNEKATRQAAEWNEKHAIGTPVIYRGDSRGEFHANTRSEASVLGGHTAVIWLEGKSGCVSLDFITVNEVNPVNKVQ